MGFPLPSSSRTPKHYDPVDDDPDDPVNDFPRTRSFGNPPLSNVIAKAETVLDDTQSVSNTSFNSSLSSSTLGEEIHRIAQDTRGTTAISTPIPGRKPLQIPAAKRKELSKLSLEVEESPTSVADLVSLSLSVCNKRKTRKSNVSTAPSSIPEESVSRDSSEKSQRRSKGRKPRRRVHFKQTCTMRRTLSRKDMTLKEIRRAWLSAEEYNRMQLRDEILADRINVGKGKPGTCIRGLESKIEVTALKKLSLRMTGIEEVLVEQERQWDEAGDAVHFFYDFPSFAYVYGPVAEEALTHAQEVAREDRSEAGKILKSSTMFRAKGAIAIIKRSRFTRRRSWA